MRGDRHGRPRILAVAAAVLAGQALSGAVFGVRDVVLTTPAGLGGIGPALFLLLYAAALSAISRGVALGRRWSRAPAIAFQLLHLPLAWFFRAADPWWAAALLAGGAVAVIGCLVSPAANAVFTEPVEPAGPAAGP